MAITNKALLNYLNKTLKPEAIRDYCPNGLQVEGKQEIKRLVTGVTASELLIDSAIELKADAIFVHHGYFWKGEDPCVIGMKRNRLKKLMNNDINLYAYHLPLDIHPEFGNNAQLATILGIESIEGLERDDALSVGKRGQFPQSLSLVEVEKRISEKLLRAPLVEDAGPSRIKTVAWCTGGGQNYIEEAAEQGIDLFITGEVSEKTIHTAREMNINFIAAGHHATERYGAKALGEHLAEKFSLEVNFVDIDNPA